MDDNICFLITVLYGHELIRCALKVKRDSLSGDACEYPMEPENRKQLYDLLPVHVQECGSIVEVDIIFEIEIVG